MMRVLSFSLLAATLMNPSVMAGVVRGYVTDVAGQPVIGARVEAWDLAYGSSGAHRTKLTEAKTDSRGKFSFDLRELGRAVLVARFEDQTGMQIPAFDHSVRIIVAPQVRRIPDDHLTRR
jgi:hypothetical protein